MKSQRSWRTCSMACFNQSIDDTRYPELSDPAVWLRYFYPFDRLRLIGSLLQLGPNGCPVFHEGSPWRRLWSSHRRQDRPYCFGRASTRFRDSLDLTPPPLIVPSKRLSGADFAINGSAVLDSGVRGFTPTLLRQVGRWLAHRFLPHSIHELSVLFATLNRSGLRPSLPARPIYFSAFRLWSASLALPTAWPTLPSADF